MKVQPKAPEALSNSKYFSSWKVDTIGINIDKKVKE